MKAFCGIDWASDHHDVAVVDGDGKLLGRARIGDDAAGLQQLLDLLAEHGDSPDEQIPVAIETSRGLLVACLRATRRPVYAINPMAAARYRERRSVSRKKSDHLDAMVLANILRTDADAHRQLPDDSELAQAVAVPARAQQDAVWDRTQAGNKLRSHLREYFPGYLAAVQPITGGFNALPARTLLAAAPTPRHAARLTRTQLKAVLKRAGRQRGIDPEVERLHAALRVPQMRHLPLVEAAMSHQTLALLGKFEAARIAADDLAEASVELFEQHPDAAVITSFPGLGALSGARVLAEIGDDRTRFADAKAQGLRRLSSRHPGLRQEPHRHGPPGQEPATRRGRIRLGLRLPERLTRRPGPLRPPTKGRRPPHLRPAQPLQPIPWLPPPLPRQWHDLQRDHRLPDPAQARTGHRSLTC